MSLPGLMSREVLRSDVLAWGSLGLMSRVVGWGYLPCDLSHDAFDVTHPPTPRTDRRLWKHYLPSTSFPAVKIYPWIFFSCYHEWRQNYEVVWTHKLWTCHLCRKLHEDFTGQSYLHIDSVWSPNMCRYPNETRKRTVKSITSNFMWSKWKLFKK